MKDKLLMWEGGLTPRCSARKPSNRNFGHLAFPSLAWIWLKKTKQQRVSWNFNCLYFTHEKKKKSKRWLSTYRVQFGGEKKKPICQFQDTLTFSGGSFMAKTYGLICSDLHVVVNSAYFKARYTLCSIHKCSSKATLRHRWGDWGREAIADTALKWQYLSQL